MPDPDGLYGKFRVARTDGRDPTAGTKLPPGTSSSTTCTTRTPVPPWRCTPISAKKALPELAADLRLQLGQTATRARA